MNVRSTRSRVVLLAIVTTGLVGCETVPTAKEMKVAPSAPAFDLVNQLYTSGGNVTTWNAIPEFNQPADFGTAYCTSTPKVGLTANWVNPHAAYVLTGHPWAGSYFVAPWINAWSDLSSSHSGSTGPGYYNWTKYQTQVSGNGTFVVKLLADNCSWIYLDGRLVGVQGTDFSNVSTGYGLTLNGTSTLEFIIFDGGGASGGKFSLETTTNPPPPLVVTDATPPVVTPTVTGTLGADGWYTSNVGVKWSVVDSESAVTTPACADLTLSANQTEQTYTCTATSSGGTTTGTVKIKIDQTHPTVTGAVTSGTLGANGWYITDVGVTWTPSSGGPSGQTLSPACNGTSLTSNSASYTFSCVVTTGAGLPSAPGTVAVKLDKSSPTISYALTGTQGTNSWYVSPVGVAWTTAAGPSGVGPCAASPAVTSDGVNIGFSCTVQAGNGKTASLTTATAKLDATKPIVTYVVTNGGTYTVDQTVSVICTASDNLSGVFASTCANVSGDAYTFPLGTTPYSATATDNAGNISLMASTSITVSVTPSSLCKLVERWVDNRGVANSLCVKLDHGDYQPFRNELEAQSGKKISAEHAAILLRLVNSL